MSLDIKYKCNICGIVKEASEIKRAYIFNIKNRLSVSDGLVNGAIHICNNCSEVIKETI